MRALHWDLTDTEFPAVRLVMGPERERIDDEELESLLEDLFPDADPGDVENFARTFQKIGKQALPVLQKMGPGMLKGAAQGGMVAGPWGALAGALGGGVASLVGGGASRGGAAPAGGISRAPAPPGAVPPAAPGAGAGAPGANPAAAQLVALLSRPETLQALLAMVMGRAGRATVPLGAQHVPVGAFANAISELAADAAHSVSADDDLARGYWDDAYQERNVDLANPAERAALLLQDVAEAMAEEIEEEEGDLDPLDVDDSGARWSADAGMEALDEMDYFDDWTHADLEEDDPLDAFETALYGE